MKRKLLPFNQTLIILMLIMLVNALSYGTIIPLLYPYASRFGITATSLGFLFASYSIFQFIATPLIGRLSDRFGRKPLLLLSLLGTSLSLALFASAHSATMLFLARILDGITGGNISVAQAVIADTTPPKQRAQAFGMLGAAFGFGFLFGPAIGGLLSSISISAPFWFSSVLAMLGVLAGIFWLKETQSQTEQKQVKTEKIFNFTRLWHALFYPTTGLLLLMTFVASLAQNSFVIGFQSVTVDVFKLSATTIGLIFSAFGLVNVMMQSFGLRWLLTKIRTRALLKYTLILAALLLTLLGFTATFHAFIAILAIYMFIPPAAPLLSGLISERTNREDQGGMLGLSQAYVSLGQIIGPILSGLVVSFYTQAAFWLSASIFALGWLLALKIQRSSAPTTNL